jgi:hypothetical protein
MLISIHELSVSLEVKIKQGTCCFEVTHSSRRVAAVQERERVRWANEENAVRLVARRRALALVSWLSLSYNFHSP